MREDKCASRSTTFLRDAEVVSLGHTGKGRTSCSGFVVRRGELRHKGLCDDGWCCMNEIVYHVMAVLMFDKEAIVEVSVYHE